jgi:phytoene synthase
MAHSLSYCAQIVKAHDPDRFLLTMLMRPEYHEDLLTLFAFNYEIAKTREVVSETMLGLMRLQWWRDSISSIFKGNEPPEHEILKPLSDVIKRRGLSEESFNTLIYAREFDLEDVLPTNLDGLLNYCDFTSTPLMSLVLQIMGDDPNGEAVHPAAVNYALMGVLRAVPFHALQRRCLLPEDLMKTHGQSVNDLYDGKPAPGLTKLVEEVTIPYAPRLKPQNRYVRASHHLSRLYYNQLKSQKYNVFSPHLTLQPPFKVLRLALANKLS